VAHKDDVLMCPDLDYFVGDTEPQTSASELFQLLRQHYEDKRFNGV
jgi:hypothetical protein